MQDSNAEAEVWALDEHRVGFKPVLSKVWNKVGQRALAPVSAMTGSVPMAGLLCRTEWYLLPRMNGARLKETLEAFIPSMGGCSSL